MITDDCVLAVAHRVEYSRLKAECVPLGGLGLAVGRQVLDGQIGIQFGCAAVDIWMERLDGLVGGDRVVERRSRSVRD
ncbi:hypothetical protein [Mycobacteroides abscessus]|uniref:hypothetical protein n=1 Tax=Mycobacteroides abscessus TaxID=36809 RepID=UPI0013F5A4B4|nr:hypothetical protein [Mycobacteroides abscessus]